MMIEYPIRDKKIIKLLKLLEQKEEITKKELRKKYNSNYSCDIQSALNIFSLELEIYCTKSALNIDKGFELVSYGTKKDTYKKIQTITKNKNYEIKIISPEFAMLTIQNE